MFSEKLQNLPNVIDTEMFAIGNIYSTKLREVDQKEDVEFWKDNLKHPAVLVNNSEVRPARIVTLNRVVSKDGTCFKVELCLRNI